MPVWSIVDPTGCGGTYTVVLSDYDDFNVFLPIAYEYSANFVTNMQCKLYLPAIRR